MKVSISSPLRRDGYKAGMIMMVVALSAMLLTTACSSDDNFASDGNTANTQAVANKGYALPVTVTATRQSDGTRAAYSEDGNAGTLSFTAGDKLFVNGKDESAGGAGWFSGALDYVPATGKFSGTIYTQNQYSGTADALFTVASADNWISATLLPVGYDSYGYLHVNTFNNDDAYDDRVEGNSNYTFATTKAAGVEQFSYESADEYNGSFALMPLNAVLNFTVTGLAVSTDVAVVLQGGGYNITKTVKTDGSGKATFAAGVSGGTFDFQNFTLTIDGNAIPLVTESTVLAAGKIYNIERSSATSLIVNPVVGQIIGSDGRNYDVGSTLPTGVTAEAVIAYVGNDTDDDTYKNGLAIELDYDINNQLIWTAAKLVCENKTAITGAKWCLPSRKQWEQMLVANGGNVANSQGLRTIITNAGGKGWEIIKYWTSTECENLHAYTMTDIGYSTFVSTDIAAAIFVRACLVF